jgi:hypothetical protein
MKYDGFVFGKRWMDTQVAEEHRLADARRLAREARGKPRGWLSERRNQVLCRLGVWLEQLGQRLQGYPVLPTLAISGPSESEKEAPAPAR